MSIRVRPFAVLGSYPKHDVRVGNDIFIHSGKLLFSCVENRLVESLGKIQPDQPAFELDNWTIQEVRLFASLFIGNGESSAIQLYPLSIYTDLEVNNVEEIVEDASLLQPLIKRVMAGDDYFLSGSRGLIPDKHSDYPLWEFDQRKIQQADLFWTLLDQDDPILIRGLHAMLKSAMLNRHYQFLDASLSQIHISLDAAYSMVLRHLKQEGVSNPTSQDAQAFIEDWWGVPRSGLKFFEDYYSDRIRNFHTDSRFGAEPIPFFCLDDITDLTELLKGLFYMFVTGEIHDETQWSLDQAKLN